MCPACFRKDIAESNVHNNIKELVPINWNSPVFLFFFLNYNLLHVSVFINSSVKFTNNFFNNNIAWKLSWQSFYCLCFPTLAYNTVHTNIAILSSLKIYSMIFKIHETISCQLIIPVWFNFIVYDNYSLLISRKI